MLFRQLLFRSESQSAFALAAIPGVLGGTPAFPAWQQRFLGPWLVRLIERAVGSAERAFEIYTYVGLMLANVLLYALLRRKQVSVALSLLATLCFVLVRAVYVYSFEYPWDALDVLLFLVFGFWTARGGTLRALAPLLALGVLNHESVLFIPFWYVLASVRTRSSSAFVGASAALGVMGVLIWLLRQRYYVGPPSLPGLTSEGRIPIVHNELHLVHNLKQLVVEDFRSGRLRIATSLWLSLALLVREVARRRPYAPAALWSLCVFTAILCFGYVNETRLYLPLLAFWFAHAWPPAQLRRPISSAG